MTKTAAAPDLDLPADNELAEYVPLTPEAEDIPEDFSSWDGRATKVVLAHPMIRDHQAVGPHSPCIDCAKSLKDGGKATKDTSHQFHIRASRAKDGSWQGPEAIHFQDLIAIGQIANTQPERDRRQRQAIIDSIRGTFGTTERPEGFPEYKPLTLQRLFAQWKHALLGGPKAVREREHAERRLSVEELVSLIGDALGSARKPSAPQE